VFRSHPGDEVICECAVGVLTVRLRLDTEYSAIGEDALDIVPAQFGVLVTRRPKYTCRTCKNGVVQARAPARPIEGGLARVLVSKYADHLPLYRQAQIYARQGLDLDRSTLADWVGHAASSAPAAWAPPHLLMRLRELPRLFANEPAIPGPSPIASEALEHI
jgi:transposase